MVYHSFVNPLFGNSQELFLPLIILPKRTIYLLSRRNSQFFTQNVSSLYIFGITEISGYDPPWRYDQKNVQGAAEKIYPTMSLEDICNLPIGEMAEKDSLLFLWTTFPKLKEGLKVIESWGFEYKTIAFLWLKQNKSGKGWFYGLGFWTRGNAEICLLATKGHPKRESKSIHQFIISPLRKHSQKPDETRDKIVELAGDLPRVELFARNKTDGWDTWGNEVECDINMEEYMKGGDCIEN